MAKKSAFITYEVTDSKSVVEAFCKQEKDFRKNITSATKKGKDQNIKSTSDLLVYALEHNLLDGSDFMILAVYGFHFVMQDMARAKAMKQMGGLFQKMF